MCEKEPLCGRINEPLRREWLRSDRHDLWQQNGQSAGRGVGLAAELLSPSVWQSPGLSCQKTTGFGPWEQIEGGELRVKCGSSTSSEWQLFRGYKAVQPKVILFICTYFVRLMT